MTDKIKVLVVGDFFSPIHEDAICKAFENNSIEVHRFKLNKYFNFNSFFKKKISNLQLKYTYGPSVHRANLDLLDVISANNFNFVFFYRPRIFYRKTLKEVATKNIVYFYNNDDPFGILYKKYFWNKYFNGLRYANHIFYYREKNKTDYNNIGYFNISLLRSYFIKYLNYPTNKIYTHDVVFIGHYENDGRDYYLKYLIENGIDLKIYGPEWNRSPLFNYFKTTIGDIQSLNIQDYNFMLNSSKIALVFLSKLNSDTYTRRCFEIPATNTFMLSEYSYDLSLLFEPMKEADYFNSKEELLNKVQFYLADNAFREYVCLNGYNKVFSSNHEVSERIKLVLNQYDVDSKK